MIAAVNNQKRIIFRIITALILFVIILLTYSPSLKHMPRSDQLAYVMDTVNDNKLADILVNSYSYNRTRKIAAGDVALFRPVLFTLLSFEKFFFDYHFRLWELTGILLHFAVVYLMYLLMSGFTIYFRKNQDSGTDFIITIYGKQVDLVNVLPFLLSLFFAVNFSIQELVIWSHINGYILFWALILVATHLTFRLIACKDSLNRRNFIVLASGAWFCLLIAAFTYELGQYFAVLTGLLCASAYYKKGNIRKPLLLAGSFILIFFIYFLINKIDYSYHLRADHFKEDVNLNLIAANLFSPNLPSNLIRYVLYTVIQPFFASIAAMNFGSGRLHVEEFLFNNGLGTGLLPVISIMVLSAWLMLTFISLKRIAAGPARTTVMFGALLLSYFSLYLAVIVLGRMNIRPGPDILRTNSYYTYAPFMLWILISYFIWAAGLFRIKSNRINKYVVLALSFCLVFTTISSAAKVYEIQSEVAKTYEPFRESMQYISEFIDEHRREPDFSIAFDVYAPSDIVTEHHIPTSVIFFKRFINNYTPKYILNVNSKGLAHQKLEEYRRAHPYKEHLFPDLIAIYDEMNVFKFRGDYVAISGNEGYMNPDRKYSRLKNKSEQFINELILVKDFKSGDPSDDMYIYGARPYLGLLRSADGGKTYEFICKGISEANSHYCKGTGDNKGDALHSAPFTLVVHNPNIMLAGAASLWRTKNVKSASPSWSVIKPPVYDSKGRKLYIAGIAMANDRQDTIWLRYSNGDNYVTSNGTSDSPAWTKLDCSEMARILGLPPEQVCFKENEEK